MIIRDIKTLKIFFQNIKTPIFGIGVYAFNRLGLENIIPNYQILSLRYGLDTELIEKDIKVFSLEKNMKNKHIQEPRNAATILKHQRIKTHLKQFQNPLLLVYKPSPKMERICQEHNWALAANPSFFGKRLFENKIKFRKILEEIKIAVPPGKITRLDKLDYGHLINKYGLPLIIQHPKRGGRKGTFYVKNQMDFQQALLKLKEKDSEDAGNKKKNERPEEVIVSQFIQGPSPSITGCVTKFGILFTNPQHQILDIPQLYNPGKGYGLFCGHDWSNSKFSEPILSKIYEYTEKVGQYLKKNSYQGIFGLDFIISEKTNEVYITECNPRLLGSFPTLNMVQLLNNEVPILSCHILEFLNTDYQLDIKEINNSIRQEKTGSQMILHNLTGQWAMNYKEIKAGIYKLKNQNLEFLRPGYDLKHLDSKEEFLITEGMPFKKSPFSPSRRLCRILTLAGVLEKYRQLTPWATQIAKTTYQAFDIRPVKWIKIKKLFYPHFLSKE